MTRRKAPEERVGRRVYAGEPGFKPRPSGGPASRRRAPRCEFLSLGPAMWLWIAAHLTAPDGPLAGQPFELNADQTALLYRWYGVDEAGLFVYRRGCWRAAQGTGKSPLLATVALWPSWRADRAAPDSTRRAGRSRCAPTTAVGADRRGVGGSGGQHVPGGARDGGRLRPGRAALLDVGLTRITLLEGVRAARGRSRRAPAYAVRAAGRRSRCSTRRTCGRVENGGDPSGGHDPPSARRRWAGRTFESTNAHAVGEGSVAEATLHGGRRRGGRRFCTSRRKAPRRSRT